MMSKIKKALLVLIVIAIPASLLLLYLLINHTRQVHNVIAPVLRYVSLQSQYDNQHGVHPALESKMQCLLEQTQRHGITVKVTEGYRSYDRQDKLYQQGRTKKGYIVTKALPGTSLHNYGFAFDVAPIEKGKINWRSTHWDQIGALGESCDLDWGGNWRSFVDRPHFQFTYSDIIFYALF